MSKPSVEIHEIVGLMPKTFLKDVVSPGKYFPRDENGKPYEVDIPLQRIKHWAKESTRLLKNGNKIPVPYVHTDAALPLLEKSPAPGSYNNAGYIRGFRVRRKDGMLQVKVEAATDEDAQRIGKAVKDVSLRSKNKWTDGLGNEYRDVITHVAAVNHPVVLNQSNFKELKNSAFSPSDGLAVSLSMAAEVIQGTNEGMGVDPPTSGHKNLLDSAIENLRKLGIGLPDDTDEMNFLDRVVVATGAIITTKEQMEGEERLDTPPQGAQRQQPTPLAMATDQELQFALENAGKDNPATGKPWTAQEIQEHVKAQQPPKPLELSAEPRVQRMMKKPYLQRIAKFKELGLKVEAQQLLDLLNGTELKFSAEDEVLENTPFHTALSAMESLLPQSKQGQLLADADEEGAVTFSMEDLETVRRPADFDDEGSPEEIKDLGDRMVGYLKGS